MTKKGSKTKAKKTDAAKPKADKAEKSAKPAKASKPKQLQIPGTERKGIPGIDAAAEALRGVRTERMQLQKDEAEKQNALLGEMKTHGVTAYIYNDDEGEEMRVELDDVIKVKVKKNKPDGGD